MRKDGTPPYRPPCRGFRLSRWVGVAAILFLWSGADFAPAHEFWIEPSSFNPIEGDIVAFDLRIGDPFPGEAFTRWGDHLRRFEIHTGADEWCYIPGIEGQAPAGRDIVRQSGWAAVVYESHPSFASLKKSDFINYLNEVGHDDLAQTLSQSWPFDTRTVNEKFTRHAKALIFVRDSHEAKPLDEDRTTTRAHTFNSQVLAFAKKTSDNYSTKILMRPVGMELELTPVFDPGKWNIGEVKSFQLLLNEKPAADVPVTCRRKGSPHLLLLKRTDTNGLVHFNFSQGGDWLITATHIKRVKGNETIDWQSRWASLRLHLPE